MKVLLAVAIILGMFLGGTLYVYGVPMKTDNQTKPLCDKECPGENWGSLQISSLHVGNSSNSTDGGKCADNICLGNSTNSTDGGKCVDFTCQISLGQSQYQEVSIYICGHFKNGTKEWCW